MKLLILGCALVCLVGYVELGAIDRTVSADLAELKGVSSPKPLQGKECAEGTKWKSQCNECRCTDEGYAHCTVKPCPGQENDGLQTCAHGTRWRDDCNECWCSKGIPMCTMAGCEIHLSLNTPQSPHLEAPETEDKGAQLHNVVKREVCKPNMSFKNECNSCNCAANGLSYTCTKNECMETERDVEVFMESEGVDHIERHSVCHPQSTFLVNCNPCVCNSDGTDYACTNKPCPVPDDVELFHELKGLRSAQNKSIVCNANRMFIKDCNTCWCNENGTGYFCTRKVCVPNLSDEPENAEFTEGLRIIKKQCRPDEVFEVDCNMCRCNPDGQSYSCTRRACFTEPSESSELSEPVIDIVEVEPKNLTTLVRERRGTGGQDAPKTCTPGQEFRMDCNRCLCNTEGNDFSCTRINCNSNNQSSRRKREVAQQVTKPCQPGELFHQECNECRCSDDGRHATCTYKRCSIKPAEGADDKSPDAADSEPDPNFRCNPGEQFRRECNDCTCSADGKSVFCTIRFCEKEITS